MYNGNFMNLLRLSFLTIVSILSESFIQSDYGVLRCSVSPHTLRAAARKDHEDIAKIPVLHIKKLPHIKIAIVSKYIII